MAILGNSVLGACNDILEYSGIAKRQAALSTGTASPIGMAERSLDRAHTDTLLEGYDDAMLFAKAYTTAGNAVTLASTVLWVRGAGPQQHRRLTTREDKLYDLVAGSSTVFTETTVYLDVIDTIDYEDLAPRLKKLIVLRGAMDLLMQQSPSATDRINALLVRIASAELLAGPALFRPEPSNRALPMTAVLGARSGKQNA